VLFGHYESHLAERGGELGVDLGLGRRLGDDLLLLAPAGRVQQNDLAGLARGDDPLAVGQKADLRGVAAGRRPEEPAAGGVPPPHRLVLPGGDERLRVGGKGDRPHGALVAHELGEELPAKTVTKLDGVGRPDDRPRLKLARPGFSGRRGRGDGPAQR
jgi:hypothetical protein